MEQTVTRILLGVGGGEEEAGNREIQLGFYMYKVI